MDWSAWSVSVSGGRIGLLRGLTPITWRWPWEWSLVPALNAPRWLPSFYNDYSGFIDWIPFMPRWSVEVPLWPMPATCAGLAWYAGKRIRRLRQGACTKCGYDMRGLAAGACCPECGGQRGVAQVISAAARARRVKRWKRVRLTAVIGATCLLVLLALATRWDVGIARGRLTTVMTQGADLTCGWASIDAGEPWRWVWTRRDEPMPSPFERTAWLSFGDWWDATTQTPAWRGGRIWLSLYALAGWSLAAIALAQWRIRTLLTPRCQFGDDDTCGLAA